MALHTALRICLIHSFINVVFLLTSEFDPKQLCLKKGIGEKAYAIASFQANWYEAHVFCRSKNMHLVSIRSKDESVQINHLIKNSAPNINAFWTSGTRLGSRGNRGFTPFVWLTDGSPMMYSDWGRNLQGIYQPDNYGGNEQCMILGNQALIQQGPNYGYPNNPFNNPNNPNGGYNPNNGGYNPNNGWNNPNNGWNNPNNGWNNPNNGWNNPNNGIGNNRMQNYDNENNNFSNDDGNQERKAAWIDKGTKRPTNPPYRPSPSSAKSFYKWADEACNNKFAFICEVICKI